MKQLGGEQQRWTSPSQTPHNCKNILFLPCSWHKVHVTALLWFKRGQLILTKTLRIFTNEKQSGLSGQITLMSKTLWYLQCHYEKKMFFDSVKIKKNPNQPPPAYSRHACSVFSGIKTSKKGRRSLTAWHSYTLCSADSHSSPKLPISKDSSCGKSVSVFTPTGCIRRNLTHSFQTGKHSGFSVNHAVLNPALTPLLKRLPSERHVQSIRR